MPQVSAKDKILAAGFQVLYAQGFNGCSVQDVTDAAGVPKGSFYNHFKNKEALALEVIRAYVAAARIDLLSVPGTPPVDRLRAHFASYLGFAKANNFTRGCLAGNLASQMAGSSDLLRDELVKQFAGWNLAVAAVLKEGQAAGTVRTDRSADQMARYVLNAWEGALLMMKVNRSPKSLDDFFAFTFPAIAPQ